MFFGVGSPEGDVEAPPGSLYLRDDGDRGPVFWVKRTATETTGWVDIASREVINVKDDITQGLNTEIAHD